MSWNDLMRRLVIGKQTSNNFSTKDLPHNRRQVFKFIYKNRALQLFSASLLCLLFFIPFIIWDTINYFAQLIELRGKTGFELYETSAEFVNTSNLINIPCLMLAFIGLAGLVYVVRKLCWNEPVAIFKDFKKGIKNSWQQYLIIGFVFSLNKWILDFSFNLLLYYSDINFALRIGLLIFLSLLCVVLLIMHCYALGLSANYNMSIIEVYKASFTLTLKKFFTNVLMLIAGIFPLAIIFMIPYALGQILGIILTIFGGIGFCVLVVSLFLYRQFDKFINEKNYPEMVNKGIYGEDETIEDNDLDSLEIEKLAEQLASEYEEESIE